MLSKLYIFILWFIQQSKSSHGGGNKRGHKAASATELLTEKQLDKLLRRSLF